ncbi:MAG TPA: hypothetical protein VG756_21135 [Pseudonocardiaceae bacterium]|jgi:hypothetical protein|nr:hypothetical protein [Pseudonocardiaceae bacterium]
MKRIFWLGVGVIAGVAASRKLNRAARQATPAGIAGNVSDALSELAGAIGTFGADVRAGMTERERELTEDVEARTGINTSPRHALRAAEDTLRASAPLPRRQPGARARRADG